MVVLTSGADYSWKHPAHLFQQSSITPRLLGNLHLEITMPIVWIRGSSDMAESAWSGCNIGTPPSERPGVSW